MDVRFQSRTLNPIDPTNHSIFDISSVSEVRMNTIDSHANVILDAEGRMPSSPRPQSDRESGPSFFFFFFFFSFSFSVCLLYKYIYIYIYRHIFAKEIMEWVFGCRGAADHSPARGEGREGREGKGKGSGGGGEGEGVRLNHEEPSPPPSSTSDHPPHPGHPHPHPNPNPNPNPHPPPGHQSDPLTSLRLTPISSVGRVSDGYSCYGLTWYSTKGQGAGSSVPRCLGFETKTKSLLLQQQQHQQQQQQQIVIQDARASTANTATITEAEDEEEEEEKR